MYMHVDLFPGVGDQSLMYESPLPLKSTRGGAGEVLLVICSLGMYMYIQFFSTASKGGGATKSKLAAPQTGKGHKQVLKPQGTVCMYSMCVCMYVRVYCVLPFLKSYFPCTVSTRSRATLKSLTDTPQPQPVDSDEGW